MSPVVSTADRLAIEGGSPFVTSPIPVGGAGREWAGKEEEEYLVQVARSGKFHRCQLPYEESFSGRLEMAIEKFLDVKHVHLTTAGSSAAWAVMSALGLELGDEVLHPVYGWQTVPAGIVVAGGVPVLAQVDETLTMEIADAERLISPKTKAIVAVHLDGAPCQMDAILELAKKHGLTVVEDVAQANGGSFNGRRLGSIGDIAFFSTNYMKTVTSGTGGFIATNRDDLFAYCFTYLGGKFIPPKKLDLGLRRVTIPSCTLQVAEMQSAVALAQFERLPRLLAHYRRMQMLLEEQVRGCKSFVRPRSNDRAGEVGWSFNLQFSSATDANRFEKTLRAEGVPNCATFASRFIAPGEVVLVPSGAPWTDKSHSTADGWTFLHEKRGLTRGIDPWAHSSVTYDPETVMAASKERLEKIVSIRINPKLTEEHVRMIGGAIRKVDHAIARSTG